MALENMQESVEIASETILSTWVLHPVLNSKIMKGKQNNHNTVKSLSY